MTLKDVCINDLDIDICSFRDNLKKQSEVSECLLVLKLKKHLKMSTEIREKCLISIYNWILLCSGVFT